MLYLIVGDGNFSFSLSLCKHQLPKLPESVNAKVVATSYESLESVLLRSGVEANLKELRECPAVQVFHQVDATKLHSCHALRKLDLTYDVIMFNFPHTGGKSCIQDNRTLLKEFFVSVSSSCLLRPSGEIHVSLCRGQGGTPDDSTQRGYNNSWKITEMATEGKFILHQVEPFRTSDFPGYIPTGYRGHTDKGFNLDGALRHVFKFPSPSQQSLHPPQYRHDLSFWCSKERSFDVITFEDLVKRVTGNSVKHVECIDKYVSHTPQSNKISYCFRLTYCSEWDALSRTQAGKLQLALRTAVEENMGVELR